MNFRRLRRIFSYLLASLLLVAGKNSRGAEPRVALPGHIASQIRTAEKIERLPPDENVSLSMVVKVDQAALDQELARLFGPGAALPRRYMTPAEITSKFDLAAKRRKLKDFASAAGLRLDEDNPDSLVVKVSAPASAVEQAFGLVLNRYKSADGQLFRAHETEPTIPASLAPHLNAVLGLSNMRGLRKPRVRTHQVVGGNRASSSGAAAPAAASQPAVILGGAGPTCFTNGSGQLQCGLSPANIKTIYGLGGTFNGSGQTIAILELDGFLASDITAYEAQYGLASPPVTCVTVDGAWCGSALTGCGPNQTDPCNATTLNGGQPDQAGKPDNGMIEVALDIDLVLALAPGAAAINVYTTQNTLATEIDLINRIRTDNTASVMSTSWGNDQTTTNGILSSYMTSENTAFSLMALQGQTVFAAASDCGAYDQVNSNGTCKTNNGLRVDDPAAQPFVSGVGGTSLTGTISPFSITESVWNNLASGGGAGGGGVANFVSGSTYWPIPAYQVGVPGENSTTFRNVPDVSLNSDPNSSPYNICVGGTCNDAVKNTTLVGGTSAAAPLWAALTLLANQQRALYALGKAGFANPTFAALGTNSSAYGMTFNDIATGGNGAFPATAGYDNASGWGSFKGDQMVNALTMLPVTASPSSVSGSVMGTSSMTFSWTLVANATYFNIYDAFSPSTLVATQSGSAATINGIPPNTLRGFLVKGANFWTQGPGTTIFVGTTLANQAAPGVIQPFISSITVNFAAGVGGASGFSLFGSTVADTYSGTVFSSTTNSGAATALSLLGLAPGTQYCLRLSALNSIGVPNPAYIGCATTVNPYVPPPIVSPPSNITQSQMQFSWTQGANPPSVNYTANASTNSNFSANVSTFQGVDQFTAVFTGLLADASYYLQVRANTGANSSTGPYATLAGMPVAAAPTFTAVGANAVTANWGYGPNPPDALFLVQASPDPTPAFSPIVASSLTSNNWGILSGLNPNTTYFFRVEAISRNGTPTAFLALGSTTTLGAPPVPTVFTNPTVTGFTAAYTNGGNGPGTVFIAQVSVDPTAAFSPVAATSVTYNTSATFAGLVPNQQYFFRAGAVNFAGGVSFNAFAQEISTFTAPVAPVQSMAAASNQTTSAIQFSWSAGANAAGTTFNARICANATCTAGGDPIQTVGPLAVGFNTFSVGLSAHTTYFAQVQALHLGPSNPDSAFVLVGASETLASPPGTPVVQPVGFTSFTVTYTACPACEGYQVQGALDPAFGSIVFTGNVGPAATSAQITGLTPATTYYVRVGALNAQGLPNYSVSASTMTLFPIQSSGTVAATGLSLQVSPLGIPLTSISLVVPPATLPNGTPVTVNTSVAYLLPPPVSNEATLIPLAAGVGFSIDAGGGAQPNGNVSVIMKYDPTLLPPGASPKNIQLARYDPAALQWTLLPTSVDTSQNVAVGTINHFSLYQPFLVAAGGDLSQINIFPLPWEPLSSNNLLNAPVVTFTNLPATANVRIMSLTGALIFSAQAGNNGVMTWDGRNRFGRTVASGTYLAVIESLGKTTVKRVVIIR